MEKVSEIIESTSSKGNSSDSNLTSGIKDLDKGLVNWRNGYPFNVNLNYKPEYLLFTDIT